MVRRACMRCSGHACGGGRAAPHLSESLSSLRRERELTMPLATTKGTATAAPHQGCMLL